MCYICVVCLHHYSALQHLGYFRMCYNCIYVIMVHYNTWGTSGCVTVVCLCHHGALQHLGWYFKMCYNCVYVITVHCNTWGTSRCVTIVFMSSWYTTTPGVLQDVLQLCIYVFMVHYKTWGTSRCVTFVLCVYVITVHCNTWGTSRCVTVVCLCHRGALQYLGYFKMCYSCVFMSLQCTATPGVIQDVLQLCCVFMMQLQLCVHDAVTVVFCLPVMSLTLKWLRDCPSQAHDHCHSSFKHERL